MKKLVIELDKVAYDLLTGKIETANIDLYSTLIQSVQKGTPLEDELEKIKAEVIGSCNNIAEEVSDLSYTRKIYVYEQLSEIKGAIDRHISELKGENNETANEFCWETGHYTTLCDCNSCPHQDECSGNDKE